MAKRHEHLKSKKRTVQERDEIVATLRRLADILEKDSVSFPPHIAEVWTPPRAHKEYDKTWELELRLYSEVNADDIEDPSENWGEEAP